MCSSSFEVRITSDKIKDGAASRVKLTHSSDLIVVYVFSLVTVRDEG